MMPPMQGQGPPPGLPPELMALLQGGGGMPPGGGGMGEGGEGCCPMCGRPQVLPFNSNEAPNMDFPKAPQPPMDANGLMAMLGGGGGQQAPMSPY